MVAAGHRGSILVWAAVTRGLVLGGGLEVGVRKGLIQGLFEVMVFPESLCL